MYCTRLCCFGDPLRIDGSGAAAKLAPPDKMTSLPSRILKDVVSSSEDAEAVTVASMVENIILKSCLQDREQRDSILKSHLKGTDLTEIPIV
jgi:hypothetical protein